MKKIVAINASPRVGWNTWSMVNEAAEGARTEQSKSHPHKTFRPPNFAKGTPNMRYNKYGSYGKW